MSCRNHPKRKEWHENTGLCNECAAEEGSRLYDEQNGLCAICGKDFGAQVNGRVPSSAQLDHNHKTGQVRGVLCKTCNLALGKFGDKPDRFRIAANYLDKWRNIQKGES